MQDAAAGVISLRGELIERRKAEVGLTDEYARGVTNQVLREAGVILLSVP